MFRISIIPYTLQFKRPAGTSRGVYHNHQVWYVLVSDADNPQRWGIGECAPLTDLSCDYDEHYEQRLRQICSEVEEKQALDVELLRNYPSMLFGLETAFRHYENQSFRLWDNPFSRGEEGISINGLIWMGDYAYMREQIDAKIKQGFGCIKLKIGAINFDDEIKLLRHIRTDFSARDITLRVDANGAFSPGDALEKLHRLAELDIHSIEQPIRAGQWSEMAHLVADTPLPIALDEELIGVNNPADKRRLLETIRPQYIILKPTLHGGISGATEWINFAEELNIAWWATSALESNIGLNAVAQWCGSMKNDLPQGLGTGALYTNNITMPLATVGDRLWFDPDGDFFEINDIL